MSFKAWLWPDRCFGKRESRALREEHNALYNSHAELVTTLKSLVEVITNDGQLLQRYYKLSDGSLGDAQNAIEKAEGGK